MVPGMGAEWNYNFVPLHVLALAEFGVLFGIRLGIYLFYFLPWLHRNVFLQ